MKTRRSTAMAAATAALVAGIASATAVSAADTPATRPTPVKTSHSAPRAGSILDGVHGALESLVAEGVIDEAQATSVQQQARAGSIDPKVLVDAGVLSNQQMQAVAHAIDQVKQSYAQP